MQKRDFVDRVGGKDTFHLIVSFMFPWEQISLRFICRDFNRLSFMKKHRAVTHYDFLEQFWKTNFQRSVIQLYCRPLLDYANGSANFFKYHTLLKLSSDMFTREPIACNRLHALKYCLKYQDELAKSSQNLCSPYNPFARNMRELEGLYISNRTESQYQTLAQFLQYLVLNYSKIDNSRFKLLFFNHCVLGDIGVGNLCRTIKRSPNSFALEILFISNDETVGDSSVRMLLDCVETHLVNVKMICLRNTGISNTACDIIHAFYRKHYHSLCQCQQKMGQNDEIPETEEFEEDDSEQMEKYPIRLRNLNITFNKGITSEGIRRLNELFFLDEECSIPHRKDCFFNSVAIGTSVSLDGTQGVKLSSRFRFLNQSE